MPTQLTDEELARYSAKGDRADAEIAKYIDEIADSNQHFELVTDNPHFAPRFTPFLAIFLIDNILNNFS